MFRRPSLDVQVGRAVEAMLRHMKACGGWMEVTVVTEALGADDELMAAAAADGAGLSAGRAGHRPSSGPYE